MLAAYHSTYLWHDLKIPQDLRAVQEEEEGLSAGSWEEAEGCRCAWEGSGFESLSLGGFLFFWGEWVESAAYPSHFQPFSSHGTHKPITKILWHTPK